MELHLLVGSRTFTAPIINFSQSVRYMDIWRGGGRWSSFAWPFLFISQGRLKAFFHLRIGWKYYIIFISTSFVDKIFISAMLCGHLFISPIFSTNIFILKKNSTPSILMVAPSPSVRDRPLDTQWGGGYVFFLRKQLF